MAVQKAEGDVFKPKGERWGKKVPNGVIIAHLSLALSVRGIERNAFRMSIMENREYLEASLKKVFVLAKGKFSGFTKEFNFW